MEAKTALTIIAALVAWWVFLKLLDWLGCAPYAEAFGRYLRKMFID